MTESFDERSRIRLQKGDVLALEELVAVYGDGLTRFAYCYVKDSATAEEMMEDAFAALWLKRGRLSHGQNLRAYLYKTVRNKCLDYLRWHKKRVPLSDYENTLSGSSIEEDILQNQRKQALYKGIQALPKEYGEALYLTYIAGYTVDETGAILKKTKKQVYNLLSRGKVALKKQLEKEGLFYEND